MLGYVSPEFRTDSPLFGVGSARGYFIRDQQGRVYLMPGMQGHPVALLDFTNPEAVHWWQFLTRSILNDPRAWEDEFTYLLGGDLLGAPVIEPGARQRRLFVPEGEWIDWWDGKRYAGPAVVTVAAPLDRIPLLVRAGAILPLAPPSGSLTRASHPRDSDVPLILRVYPASDAIGQRRLTLFDGVEVTVRRTATGRLAVDRTGTPGQRTLLLVLVGEPEPPLSVRVRRGSPLSPWSGGQGGSAVFSGWWHDPQTAETTIAVPGNVDGLEVHAPMRRSAPSPRRRLECGRLHQG